MKPFDVKADYLRALLESPADRTGNSWMDPHIRPKGLSSVLLISYRLRFGGIKEVRQSDKAETLNIAEMPRQVLDIETRRFAVAEC